VFPEDFVVKEKIALDFVRDGRYKIYLLKKRSWNTMDALLKIAAKHRMPLSKIGYGGRKDRHALTYQYISVPREYDLSYSEPNVELSFVGFADDFISPAILQGNYFELVLRKIKKEEKEHILTRLREVEKFGYPNYFDDQRFGSVEREDEFIAERILKKHYNGALKLYFTTIHPEDKREEKERKRMIAELWGKWDEIIPLLKTKTERDVMAILKVAKSKNDMVRAIDQIPKEQLSMYFSAFQSYLWNKTLEDILPLYTDNLYEVKGKIMSYRFYKTLEKNQLKTLKNLEIPTVSYKIPDSLPEVKETINRVLAERSLKPSDFNLRKIRKSFFKSFFRNAVVFPEDLYVYEFEEDDFYKGYFKLKIKFSLPTGSFATMLIKSLTI